jgi:hypothetical protein
MVAAFIERGTMHKTDFLNLYEAMTREELETFQAKNADYADRSSGNVLAQFDRLAAILGTTPAIVLIIFLEKHFDAIRAYCRHGDVKSEPIAGRIKDARIYLALLRAMVEGVEDESQS